MTKSGKTAWNGFPNMSSRTEITVCVDSEVLNCTDRMNICASDDDRRVGKLQQPAGRWTPHHLCLLTIKLQPVRPHPAVHVISTFCDVGRQSRCGIRLAGTIYLTVIGMYCRETVKCHIELGHLIYDSVVKQSGWLPAELLVLLAGSGLPIKLAVSCSQICVAELLM